MNPRQLSLLSLPTEVLLLITEYLDNHDLNLLLGVSELYQVIGAQFILLSDKVANTMFPNITNIYHINKDSRKIKKKCMHVTRIVVEIHNLYYTLPRGCYPLAVTDRHPAYVSVFDPERRGPWSKDIGSRLLAQLTTSPFIKSVSFEEMTTLETFNDVIDTRILSFPVLKKAIIDSSRLLPESSRTKLNAPLLDTVAISTNMDSLIGGLDFTSPALTSLELFNIRDTNEWSDQSCPSLTSLEIKSMLPIGPRPLQILHKLSFERLFRLSVQSHNITQLSNLYLPSLNDMNITTTALTLSIFEVSAPNLEHIGIKTVELTHFHNNNFSSVHDVEIQAVSEAHHDGSLIDLTCLSSVQFYMTNKCLSVLEFTDQLKFLCVDSSCIQYLDHTPRSLRAVEFTGLSEPMLEYANFSTFGQLDSLCFTNCTESIDLFEIFSYFPSLKQLDIQECPFDPPTDLFSESITHLTLLHDSDYPPRMIQCKFPNLKVLKLGIPFGDSLCNNLTAPLLKDLVIVSTAPAESLTIEKFDRMTSLEIVCEPDLKTLRVSDCEMLEKLEISNNTWLENLTVCRAPKLESLSLDLFEKPPIILVDVPLLERADQSTDTEVIFEKQFLDQSM